MDSLKDVILSTAFQESVSIIELSARDVSDCVRCWMKAVTPGREDVWCPFIKGSETGA